MNSIYSHGSRKTSREPGSWRSESVFQSSATGNPRYGSPSGGSKNSGQSVGRETQGVNSITGPPVPPKARIAGFAAGVTSGLRSTMAKTRETIQAQRAAREERLRSAQPTSFKDQREEEVKKWKICGCLWTKRTCSYCCCCFAIFIFFFGLFFFRSPEFEQDLDNLEFNELSFQEINLEFPLIFENNNFLPVGIEEVEATATFDNFEVDIILDYPVELPARSVEQGNAQLILEFDGFDLFGAAGDFIGACLAGDEIPGIVEASATGTYLGVTADQDVDPEEILLDCPIRFRQTFLQQAVTAYGSVDNLQRAFLQTRSTSEKLRYVNLFQQLKTQLNL